jgi:hypothetical protein
MIFRYRYDLSSKERSKPNISGNDLSAIATKKYMNFIYRKKR